MMLNDLFGAHMEWLGVRKTLKGQERRKFERWVARVHPEIAAEFRGQPGLFRQQCREVARGSALPMRRGIGPVTLRRHASAIFACWKGLPELGRQPFGKFVEELLATCESERALLRSLRERSGARAPTTPIP